MLKEDISQVASHFSALRSNWSEPGLRNLGRGISRQNRMQMSFGKQFLIEVLRNLVPVLDLEDLFQLLSVTPVLSATSRFSHLLGSFRGT